MAEFIIFAKTVRMIIIITKGIATFKVKDYRYFGIYI